VVKKKRGCKSLRAVALELFPTGFSALRRNRRGRTVFGPKARRRPSVQETFLPNAEVAQGNGTRCRVPSWTLRAEARRRNQRRSLFEERVRELIERKVQIPVARCGQDTVGNDSPASTTDREVVSQETREEKEARRRRKRLARARRATEAKTLRLVEVSRFSPPQFMNYLIDLKAKLRWVPEADVMTNMSPLGLFVSEYGDRMWGQKAVPGRSEVAQVLWGRCVDVSETYGTLLHTESWTTGPGGPEFPEGRFDEGDNERWSDDKWKERASNNQLLADFFAENPEFDAESDEDDTAPEWNVGVGRKIPYSRTK